MFNYCSDAFQEKDPYLKLEFCVVEVEVQVYDTHWLLFYSLCFHTYHNLRVVLMGGYSSQTDNCLLH